MINIELECVVFHILWKLHDLSIYQYFMFYFQKSFSRITYLTAEHFEFLMFSFSKSILGVPFAPGFRESIRQIPGNWPYVLSSFLAHHFVQFMQLLPPSQSRNQQHFCHLLVLAILPSTQLLIGRNFNLIYLPSISGRFLAYFSCNKLDLSCWIF